MPPTKKLPTAIDQQIGQRIRMRRGLIGINQQALADAIGVSYQQVQKYENGVDRVGASRLFSISQALNVPIGYFFEKLLSNEMVGQPAERARAGDHRRADDNALLLRAFDRIADGEIRTRLVELATTLARYQSAPLPNGDERDQHAGGDGRASAGQESGLVE
jgi:transcriptional regulator with XRE-family HTH domain